MKFALAIRFGFNWYSIYHSYHIYYKANFMKLLTQVYSRYLQQLVMSIKDTNRRY